jgi:hypothetical protein
MLCQECVDACSDVIGAEIRWLAGVELKEKVERQLVELFLGVQGATLIQVIPAKTD